MPGVFPDYPAPVIRNSGGERRFANAAWRIIASQNDILVRPKLAPFS
jgi:hypothetical protein